MARRLIDMRNAPQLRPFVLRNVRPTGRKIGDGSYGTVEELDMLGLVCAGKKLHDIFVQRSNMGDGTANIIRRFVDECSLLSGLRHPNIVQFLGVCFLEASDLPILVMEFLPYCLDSLLDPAEGTERVEIPLGVKYDILSDTAQGLVHLHTQTPPVIHRDLTAKNVLLTSAMIGKVADLGVARILNLRPGRRAANMTKAPGTQAYMPPEVLEENPKYNTSIDVFSFGHLALYTIVGDFPYPTAPTCPDPHNPGKIVGMTEVQRRSRQMQKLSRMLGGEGHPLVEMVRQCLHNDSKQRPSARQVLDQLQQIRAQNDDPYRNMSKLELIQVLRQREGREREVALQAQVTRLEHQLQAQEVALEASRAETQQVQHHLQASEVEIEASRSETQHIQGQLRSREQEIQELREQLRMSEATITELTRTSHQSQTLDPPLSFTNWRQSRDLLFGTTGACAVVLDGKLYVGGGRTGGTKDEYAIQVYTTESGGWRRLQCAVKRFAVAVLNQQLVVVGGTNRAHLALATIQALDSSSQRWTAPYPKMPTARHSPAAVGYQQYLLVAGGYCGSPLASVEVLNTTNKQWATTVPLPVECFNLNPALVGETLYLLGGEDSYRHNVLMFSAAIPDLLFYATITPQTGTLPPTWGVTDTECYYCTAVCIHNSLLAMGGEAARGTRTSAIHLYDPQTRRWTMTGNLPAALSQCSCVILSSGELAVLGGSGGSRSSLKMYVSLNQF